MYALAINGSPRKDGNTELLLKAALQPLEAAGWQTELVQVGGKRIQGCRACMQCAEKQLRQCVMDNDVFNEIWKKMEKADALLLGSPTYFSNVSAELKALMDRAGFVAVTNGYLLRGKIGAAVVAARRGGAVPAYDSINHMFLMSQVIVPGSSYWNMGYGLEKGEVASDAEALTNMRHLGQTINWLGKAIAPHAAVFPQLDVDQASV